MQPIKRLVFSALDNSGGEGSGEGALRVCNLYVSNAMLVFSN